MLVLTRKSQERIRIGDDIVISIVKIKGNAVSVGIEAPREVRVLRGELQVHNEVVGQTPNEEACQANAVDVNAVEANAVEANAVEANAVEANGVEAESESEDATTVHASFQNYVSKHLRQTADCPLSI